MHDPILAGIAFSIATLEEKRRYGILPHSSASELLAAQAELLVSLIAGTNMAKAPTKHSFDTLDIPKLIFSAIIRGWEAKWKY